MMFKMKGFEPAKDAESPLTLFDCGSAVLLKGQFWVKNEAEIFKTVNYFNRLSFYCNWLGRRSVTPVIDDEFLGLGHIEFQEIFLTPDGKRIHGRLIFLKGGIVRQKPKDCGVVRKLDEGAGQGVALTVIGVNYVEKRAENTALGGTSAHGNHWGHCASHLHCLRSVSQEVEDPPYERGWNIKPDESLDVSVLC